MGGWGQLACCFPPGKWRGRTRSLTLGLRTGHWGSREPLCAQEDLVPPGFVGPPRGLVTRAPPGRLAQPSQMRAAQIRISRILLSWVTSSPRLWVPLPWVNSLPQPRRDSPLAEMSLS